MKREKPETMGVEEAARRLGVSRNMAYQQVRAGRIPSLRLGRKLLIPRIQFERLLSGELVPQKQKGGRRAAASARRPA